MASPRSSPSSPFASIWCGANRPEAARTAVMTQGHSLNRYRVNNVIADVMKLLIRLQSQPAHGPPQSAPAVFGKRPSIRKLG